MSASRSTPFSQSSARNSSRERVEWPMVRSCTAAWWHSGIVDSAALRLCPYGAMHLCRCLGILSERPVVKLNSMPSYYADHAQQLKRDLAAEIPVDELRALHQKRPLLHALLAAADFGALFGAAYAIAHFDRWYLWLPFAIVAGFAIFDFTVLLHEVV